MLEGRARRFLRWRVEKCYSILALLGRCRKKKKKTEWRSVRGMRNETVGNERMEEGYLKEWKEGRMVCGGGSGR